MQGRLSISGFFLSFSVSTRLSGTIHITATEEKREMKGRLCLPCLPSLRACRSMYGFIQSNNKRPLPGTAVLGPWPQILLSGFHSHRFFCSWSGYQNSLKLPRRSTSISSWENHCSKSFLSNLISHPASYGSRVLVGSCRGHMASFTPASWLYCVNWSDLTKGAYTASKAGSWLSF